MPAKLIGTLTKADISPYPNQNASRDLVAKVRLYWDRAILTIDRYHPYTSKTNPNMKMRVILTETKGWTRTEVRMQTDQPEHKRPIEAIHYYLEPIEPPALQYRWSIRLTDCKLPAPTITLSLRPSYDPGNYFFLSMEKLDPADPNVEQVINALRKHFGDA